MRKALSKFVAISLFFSTCCAFPIQARDDATKLSPLTEGSAQSAQYRARLEAAKEVVFGAERSTDEYTAANKVLTAALADPMFRQLTKREQGSAYSGAGWAAMRLIDLPRARDMLDLATRLDPEDSENWVWLAKLEYELHHYDAAAIALTAYARQAPGEMDAEQDFTVDLVRKAEFNSQSRLDLLQALFDNNWNPKPLGASDMWFELALARVERSEPEAARAAIERITWPEILVRLRSDKRFDGLIDREARQFDVQSASSRRVDELRVRTILDPTKLQYIVELTYAMLADGMNEAVVEISDGVEATIAHSNDKAPFVDIDRRVWIMNNRSIALYRLGRAEESLQQLERAALVEEDGHANVSQILNLSYHYCGLGRADDASATVAKTGTSISGFGNVVLESVKHCVAILKGDKDAEAKALANMREHRKDNQATYLWALIRSNQMDEAARVIVERLESHADRSDMLFDLQDFLAAKPLPEDVQAEQRWQQLVAREDVRKAAERVGRIEHNDIYDIW